MSRKDIYKAESKYWNDIVSGYVSAFRLKTLNVRNVLDMRAGYGGYNIFVLFYFFALQIIDKSIASSFFSKKALFIWQQSDGDGYFMADMQQHYMI